MAGLRQNLNILNSRLASMANRVGGPIPSEPKTALVPGAPIGMAAQMAEMAADSEELVRLASRLDDLL